MQDRTTGSTIMQETSCLVIIAWQPTPYSALELCRGTNARRKSPQLSKPTTTSSYIGSGHVMPDAVRDVAGFQQVMGLSGYRQYWKITQHLGHPSARLSPASHAYYWQMAAAILAPNPRPRAMQFNFVLGALTTFS